MTNAGPLYLTSADTASPARWGARSLAALRTYMGLAQYADIRIQAHWLNVLASDYLGRKPAFEDPEDGTKFWVDLH